MTFQHDRDRRYEFDVSTFKLTRITGTFDILLQENLLFENLKHLTDGSPAIASRIQDIRY